MKENAPKKDEIEFIERTMKFLRSNEFERYPYAREFVEKMQGRINSLADVKFVATGYHPAQPPRLTAFQLAKAKRDEEREARRQASQQEKHV